MLLVARGSRAAAAARAAGSGLAGVGTGLLEPATAPSSLGGLEDGARRRSSRASNWPRLPV